MKIYPENTAISLLWGEIIRRKDAPPLSERASSRMVKIAAHLPPGEFVGWQMEVPTEGLARISSFGSAAVQLSDLEWIAEEAAKTQSSPNPQRSESEPALESMSLYEISLGAGRKASQQIGFGTEKNGNVSYGLLLPMSFSRQFGELVRVLRMGGAVLRYTVGGATAAEQNACKSSVFSSFAGSAADASDYTGVPVRAKILLALAPTYVPPARLRAVVHDFAAGTELKFLGKIEEQCEIWKNPLSSPEILPDIAARILAFEPSAGDAPIIGIESCEKDAATLPAGHRDPSATRTLKIGSAMGTSGLCREIKVGEADIKRHWQIVGQTGTGKSTLLASAVLEAVESGCGVTFFDPHGSTIDVILHSMPKKHLRRIRVARFGDTENPVPVNIWNAENPAEAEKTISDLNMLFGEIFDPRKQGFLGPRWERWFAVFASAAIALLGRQASFESIVALSRSKENMSRLATAIAGKDKILSETIRTEYAKNNSNDFADVINWCVSKMQRLTSIPQLRNTLGAGANALDFNSAIDENTVTLIDLALPEMGANASRVLGTLLLLQLWNATLKRKKRDKTHIVAIDEAHLFQTNPLPQMLAEGRKFGIAMILAHQHCGQLTEEVRDALEANSANFSAFRLSPRDAESAVTRLDEPRLYGDLCRLNAFNALTTLSIDGVQTPSFTLQIERPKESAEDVSTEIEKRSVTALVEPYRERRALTQSEVLARLEEAAANPEFAFDIWEEPQKAPPKSPTAQSDSTFINRLKQAANS